MEGNINTVCTREGVRRYDTITPRNTSEIIVQILYYGMNLDEAPAPGLLC